ncbi:uncharacterized protein LOC127864943 [Dreissena polymorpha]|uniref:uncharacterized protein LOC127864943 n=1 Tax=Dreissena polymorpha TaxID=45954 RepID=UPI0022654D3B|nr:uncharacterized protein LOC127864943 [Dreissena polymorpha]
MAKTRIDTSRHQRRAQRRLALTPVVIDENQDIAAANALLKLGSNSPKFVEKGTDPGPDPKDARLKELETQVNYLEFNYSSLQQEYQRLLEENRTLKQELGEKKFTHTNLKNNEIKTLTGLPSCAVFMWILTLVSLGFKKIGNLNNGDQLLLVLMKLKLNLTNADLAIRFNICPTQVSKFFSNCVPIISTKLKFLIRWPGKGTILKNMPKSFQLKYKKCRVIIDCSEIFIQRPSNLDTRAKTYSNYKHHNTLKFLVGITSYGAISFLSKCWGGRVSDKEITAKCGFYEKLENGDRVLADRGFLISEELAVRGASLAIPPFTKGKKQLGHREVEVARRLSRVRIHVERAIERIKNFQILKHTLPISLIKHADDILQICGALTNLQPKLVK